MVAREVSDDFMGKDIEVTRYEHLQMSNGSARNRKEEVAETDFVLGEVSLRMNQIFSICDMSNPRFYKYQSNLLSLSLIHI